MKRRLALAVRPYPDPLRSRVFSLLSDLGIEVRAPAELGTSVSNVEAVRHVAAQRPDLLLIPFHVVRAAGGDRTSGLELLLALRRAHPRFDTVPVVMPVSIFAQVAFEAAWREAAPADVFALFERELESDETRLALRLFLVRGTTGVEREAEG